MKSAIFVLGLIAFGFQSQVFGDDQFSKIEHPSGETLYYAGDEIVTDIEGTTEHSRTLSLTKRTTEITKNAILEEVYNFDRTQCDSARFIMDIIRCSPQDIKINVLCENANTFLVSERGKSSTGTLTFTEDLNEWVYNLRPFQGDAWTAVGVGLRAKKVTKDARIVGSIQASKVISGDWGSLRSNANVTEISETEFENLKAKLISETLPSHCTVGK